MSNRYPHDVDVAIVGSGPSGAAYGRILAESQPGLNIAMFEAGPTVTSPPGAHVKNIADPEDRRQAQRLSAGPNAGAATVDSPGEVTSGDRRARPGTFLLENSAFLEGDDGLPLMAMSSNVGGMAAHWTGACPRPQGSERMRFLPDLPDFLTEAERLLGVTPDAFDGSPFEKTVRTRLAAAVDGDRAPHARVQRMPLAVHRREDGLLVWAGSDVVLGGTTFEHPGFNLYDESQVVRVIVQDGRASGVRVHDRRDGHVMDINAKMVVVAADALRTPQLLWASGVRPEALGRYLNDQAQVVFAVRIREAEEGSSSETVPAAGLSATSGVTWVPYTDEEPFHGQIMQLDASPVPVAEDDPIVPGSVVGLGLFCAKELSHEDRVEFVDGDVDDFGMPTPRIRYSLSTRDREHLDRARRTIVHWGRAIGEPLNEDPFTLPPGSSLHYQGTTRMGPVDDGTSVCGPNSEVWGTTGLFVAGNGVISTSTACNPTLTSVALAIRGAGEIARRLS